MIYYPKNKTQPKFINGDIVLVKGCGLYLKVAATIYSYRDRGYHYYLSDRLWYPERELVSIEKEELKEEDMW